jgi:GNAT superfamily N-acetyltransferase
MTELKPSLTFRPLTPAMWKDFEALFGRNGACAGCWCMWPRRTRAQWRESSNEANRRAFARIVGAAEPPGILAYRDGRPVGWIAFAPRKVYARLENSRVLRPIDDEPVWSIICFFVKRGARRTGITSGLLRAALAHIRKRGARIVEAYPVDVALRTSSSVLWHGLASTFVAAGFKEVARRSRVRPILRRRLRPIRNAVKR